MCVCVVVVTGASEGIGRGYALEVSPRTRHSYVISTSIVIDQVFYLC